MRVYFKFRRATEVEIIRTVTQRSGIELVLALEMLTDVTCCLLRPKIGELNTCLRFNTIFAPSTIKQIFCYQRADCENVIGTHEVNMLLISST